MSSRISRRLFLGLAFASTLTAGFAAATPDILDGTHANVRAVIALQNKVTRDLLKTAGVLGTAVGLDDNGNTTLVIYVDRNDPRSGGLKPPAGGNVTVVIEPTDAFRAFVAPAGKGGPGGGSGGSGSVNHKSVQAFPIQLGTSGGWSFDLANGYCCGGTLGSLVQVNGVQYILSNYHVFESDVVLGGNNTIATTGNPIIQPGLIDVSCNAANAHAVASLVKLGSLPNYNVDVGLAQATPGAVSSSILEIGSISSSTVNAFLRQAVKKSGRTTGLTKNSITGLNATISVAYDNECAGGRAFTKTFTGQIVVGNRGSSFLNSGDSGSLMVEDVATNPRAVGLLYAGSSSTAIANPIGDVLAFIGSQLGGTATMVGSTTLVGP